MKTDRLKVAEASSAPRLKSEHLKNKRFSVALVQDGRRDACTVRSHFIASLVILRWVRTIGPNLRRIQRFSRRWAGLTDDHWCRKVLKSDFCQVHSRSNMNASASVCGWSYRVAAWNKRQQLESTVFLPRCRPEPSPKPERPDSVCDDASHRLTSVSAAPTFMRGTRGEPQLDVFCMNIET